MGLCGEDRDGRCLVVVEVVEVEVEVEVVVEEDKMQDEVEKEEELRQHGWIFTCS